MPIIDAEISNISKLVSNNFKTLFIFTISFMFKTFLPCTKYACNSAKIPKNINAKNIVINILYFHSVYNQTHTKIINIENTLSITLDNKYFLNVRFAIFLRTKHFTRKYPPITPKIRKINNPAKPPIMLLENLLIAFVKGTVYVSTPPINYERQVSKVSKSQS